MRQILSILIALLIINPIFAQTDAKAVITGPTSVEAPKQAIIIRTTGSVGDHFRFSVTPATAQSLTVRDDTTNELILLFVPENAGTYSVAFAAAATTQSTIDPTTKILTPAKCTLDIKLLQIQVNAGPVIPPTPIVPVIPIINQTVISPVSLIIGQSMAIQLTATNNPTSFATVTPLPSGLTLSSQGMISGLPTTSGSFTSAITASNQSGVSPPFTITFNIQAAPPPPPPPPPADPLLTALNAAYAKDIAAGNTTATHKTILSTIYQQAALKTVPDPTLTLPSQVFDAMRAAIANPALNFPASTSLLNVRKAIADYESTSLNLTPSSVLDQPTRQAIASLFTKISQNLDQIPLDTKSK